MNKQIINLILNENTALKKKKKKNWRFKPQTVNSITLEILEYDCYVMTL